MSKESSIKVFAENASGTRPANAIPVWIDNISAIGGGGGGGDFDPTYMSAQIDNKLNKSEISFRKWGVDYVTAISGKELSARYAVTAQNANTATTAIYDDNGNYLSQTYDNLTALNQFVQSNSANWEGGSSPAGEGVLFHKYTYQPSDGGKGSTDSFVANASSLYFEASVYSEFTSPSNIIIEHNGSFVGEAYWTQVSSDGSYNYFTASYNGLSNGEYKLNNNGYDSYNWCYVSANGVRTDAFNQGQYKGSTDKTIKLNVQGYNITGSVDGINHGSFTPLTSFTGSLTDLTAKGYEEYVVNINAEDYNYEFNYNISAEFEEGSTVASSDVFPPTNNLNPYTTYYLGWNANNGGLFWYEPSNGGN
jgi:hypothetical protein